MTVTTTSLVNTANLAKSCHEWGYLAVVGCIHISTGMDQELDHVKMAAVCRQPQRSVPFLVSYINMGTPAKTGRKAAFRNAPDRVETG